MKQISRKNLPKIKKELKFFLQSEEGKIVEKDAAKLAISLLVVGEVLSDVMTPMDAHAAPRCVHASHGSHGSHGRGGWCTG